MDVLNPLVRRKELEEREYQIRIAERAIQANTLVVLPTGLGKTVIAALVASHFLYNFSDQKVLVMAPTRPLIAQHRETFLRLLRLRDEEVKVMTGKLPQPYRLREWRDSYRVYFATPETVRNDLAAGLRLDRFSLLIFDEAHRAVKNYAYTKVAEAYVSHREYPMILALTASPGAERGRIREVCKALYIERIEARTEEDPDVRPYVKPVRMDVVKVELPDPYTRAEDVLREMLVERLGELRRQGYMKKDPRYVFRRDLLELGDELKYRIEMTTLDEERGPLYSVLTAVSQALILYHAIELLEGQGAQILAKFLDDMWRGRKRIYVGIMRDGRMGRLLGILKALPEHPKMAKLFEIVLGQMASKPSSKVLIFAQYRDTASQILGRLRGLGVKAGLLVGQREGGMKQEEQVEVIHELGEGRMNCLVATSIGEEGLDIPNVDLVVFYEPVPSEIRFIQRRGRTGRQRFGRVVILEVEGGMESSYLRSGLKRARRMKDVIRSLNSELKGLGRGRAPEPKPMEEDEMAPEVGASEAGELIDLERTSMRAFERELRLAAKQVLDGLMRDGGKGKTVPELVEEHGFSPGVTEEAVKKLVEEGQLIMLGPFVYPRGTAMRAAGVGEVHEFEVERVGNGRAVLTVDDRFRAILLPSDFSGPRHLIRRGRRFKATAGFYRVEGKMHTRIYGVVNYQGHKGEESSR